MDKILDYININIEKTIRNSMHDTDDGLIGLPHPYTVPSTAETNFFQEMYYWDTYFTCKGLNVLNRWDLTKNNTDNILYVINKYGYMPNGTRKCLFGRSQPPVLSLMVKDVYNHYKDEVWLLCAYETLNKEYDFWMSKRITPTGLNSYGGEVDDMDFYAKIFRERVEQVSSDIDDYTLGRHCITLCESGWDMNPKMGFESYNYVSPDLNALLYIFEKYMAEFSKVLKKDKENLWEERAEKRRILMNKY